MRHPTRPAAIVAVTIGVLLAAVPAVAKGVPYLIEVESYDPQPVLEEETEIVIVLHDPADPEPPLQTDLLEPPLEIRQVNGNGWIRPDFERLDSISFRARFTYRLGGDWTIIAHPSFPVRDVIPADYPLELTVTVGGAEETTASGSWEGLTAVLGFGALLLAMAVWISRSRWRRGRPEAPNTPGDTWWSG